MFLVVLQLLLCFQGYYYFVLKTRTLEKFMKIGPAMPLDMAQGDTLSRSSIFSFFSYHFLFCPFYSSSDPVCLIPSPQFNLANSYWISLGAYLLSVHCITMYHSHGVFNGGRLGVRERGL